MDCEVSHGNTTPEWAILLVLFFAFAIYKGWRAGRGQG